MSDDNIALRPSDALAHVKRAQDSLNECLQNVRQKDIGYRMWAGLLIVGLICVTAFPSWAPVVFGFLVLVRVCGGKSNVFKSQVQSTATFHLESAFSLLEVMASAEETPALPPKPPEPPPLPDPVRALLEEHIARHRIGSHSAERLRAVAVSAVALIRSGEPCTQRLLRLVENVSGPPWEPEMVPSFEGRAAETKLLFQMRIPLCLHQHEGIVLEPTLANWVAWLKLAETWFVSGSRNSANV